MQCKQRTANIDHGIGIFNRKDRRWYKDRDGDKYRRKKETGTDAYGRKRMRSRAIVEIYIEPHHLHSVIISLETSVKYLP